MIAIAFILFAILIVAWLMAPSSEKTAKPAKMTVEPAMKVSGSPAD